MKVAFFQVAPIVCEGWISNTLGPGRSQISDLFSETKYDNDELSLVAPGGEWILEFNAEYRYDVWQYLEMALFTDVGNVWFHRSENTIRELGEKSVLSPENLRLGWDAGVGFRFDFSFLILRLDFAQQIYAPDLENPWVPNQDLDEDLPRWRLNLGINYPF